MIWNPVQLLWPKRFLGIDIGTSFLKIVEISRSGHRRKLENYGSLSASILYEKPFRTFEKSTLLLSSNDIARAILAILDEAKIKNRQVIFSIPDFSTFFTTIELPPMTKEELPSAVRFEARQHVPLPVGEVTLDWQIIGGQALEQRKANLKILLVAVPNEVINQYREIARIAQLDLVALEAEVFGLIRCLIPEDERRMTAIIDIGARSTTCNIVERKILKTSHSFDMSGGEFTRVISKSLSIDDKEAENLKKQYGIAHLAGEGPGREVGQILLPLVDLLLKEVKSIIYNFSFQKEDALQKVIISGGSAFMPGLQEYLSQNLKKEVEIANPFFTSDIFYPPILEKKIKEMGPAFAIAVGMALRGLEQY